MSERCRHCGGTGKVIAHGQGVVGCATCGGTGVPGAASRSERGEPSTNAVLDAAARDVAKWPDWMKRAREDSGNGPKAPEVNANAGPAAQSPQEGAARSWHGIASDLVMGEPTRLPFTTEDANGRIKWQELILRLDKLVRPVADALGKAYADGWNTCEAEIGRSTSDRPPAPESSPGAALAALRALDEAEVGLLAHSEPYVPVSTIRDWLTFVRAALREAGAGEERDG
jgi:hypothetical protein